MQLDYLKLDDKNEYLRLTDLLVDEQVNDNLWKSFFETYEQSDMRAIYMVRVMDKNKLTTIGTVTTIVEPKIYFSGPVIHIEDLIVFPKYQRLGLGTKIVKEVEKLAESYNASLISVACGNEDIMKFFVNALIGTDRHLDRNEAAFGFTFTKWL